MFQMEHHDFQNQFTQKYQQAWSVLGLFDSLPMVAFYAKDRESRFVRVNQMFVEMHGFSAEKDMLGHSDHDFHPPLMAEAYIAEDRRVMNGGVAIRNQTWLVFHRQQLPNWYVSTKVPLFGTDGGVIGIAGAMYNVEQPAELERFFRELSPVIRHIKKNYAGLVTMVEMAALSGLSSTHFNRRFQELLRMTPTAYLRSMRIQAARQLLGNTNRTLAQIAQETGFTDQSHFTRCFRETTGMTPGGYRTRFSSKKRELGKSGTKSHTT